MIFSRILNISLAMQRVDGHVVQKRRIKVKIVQVENEGIIKTRRKREIQPKHQQHQWSND